MIKLIREFFEKTLPVYLCIIVFVILTAGFIVIWLISGNNQVGNFASLLGAFISGLLAILTIIYAFLQGHFQKLVGNKIQEKIDKLDSSITTSSKCYHRKRIEQIEGY